MPEIKTSKGRLEISKKKGSCISQKHRELKESWHNKEGKKFCY